MPGNYFVWAQASGYVTEYYNNVYDPSLATTVASNATNIDFTLGLAGSISGEVRDGAGNPIQFALVNAEDDDFTGYDYTGADGTYNITGLTPDSYVVWAEADGYTTEYYNNVYDSSSATWVTVTALNETSGIDFTLGVPDVTPPTTPVVTDDGSTTTNTSQLHATWSSSDPESGISEYQYAIGTTSGGIDIVAWTSAGTNTQVTKTGLSLTVGTTYYFSVQARNGAGLWSGVGVSDGIKVIGTVTPPTAVVIPAAQKVAKGGTFSVDIMVDPSGYGVSGGELNIAFDPSAMSVVDMVFGDLFGANPLVGAKQIDNTLGTAKYALARVGATAPPTSTGIFATITFTAKSKAGTYPIDITSTRLADENFNDLPAAAITNSSVTVGYPRWDINQDGKVDYKDLAILGAHYGETPAPPYPAWDINQDGKVDYKDLAILGAHYGESY
jgi:uncharacterized membrane protein